MIANDHLAGCVWFRGSMAPAAAGGDCTLLTSFETSTILQICIEMLTLFFIHTFLLYPCDDRYIKTKF